MKADTNVFSVSCLSRVSYLQRDRDAGAVYSLLNPDFSADRLPSFGTSVRHRVYFLYDQERGRYEDQVVDATSRFISEMQEARPLHSYAHTIFHCHGGVSRSTAACYIATAMAYGEDREETAFERLLEITNKPWPNLRMIEQADAELKLGGQLVAPLLRYRARFPRRLAAYRRLNGTRGFLSTVIRDETTEQP